ncbi:hypothetical protein E8E11_007318, partial [Didymella keratinophila]
MFINHIERFDALAGFSREASDSYSWARTGITDVTNRTESNITEAIKRAPDTWSVGQNRTIANTTRYFGWPIQYCLSERAVPDCKLQVNPNIAVIVTALNFEARTWETLPATLFTNHLVFASSALVQAASAFSIILESFAESRRKLTSEWGQSAALIVAGVAIVHVGYTFVSLFRHDAMERRLSVCKTNKHSIAWAHPQLPFRFGTIFKSVKQRWPFGKTPVQTIDELLVDITEHRRHHELNLSKEDQDALWQELLDAFNMNDATYVLDCLHRGAPVNRVEENSREYPIHMAARVGNMEVLKRLQPPGGTLKATRGDETELRDSEAHRTTTMDRPISQNADSHTLLTVAVGANQPDAVS